MITSLDEMLHKSISFWISPKPVTGYIAKKRVAILKKKGKNNKYLYH
jgi:hypothetical protein